MIDDKYLLQKNCTNISWVIGRKKVCLLNLSGMTFDKKKNAHL